MKNIRMEIVENTLTIQINLDQEFGMSKSGRSVIVASSEGNVPLVDNSGYRLEKLNMTISKPVPK